MHGFWWLVEVLIWAGVECGVWSLESKNRVDAEQDGCVFEDPRIVYFYIQYSKFKLYQH